MNTEKLEYYRNLTQNILNKLNQNLSIDLSRFEETQKEVIPEILNQIVINEDEKTKNRIFEEFIGYGPLSELILDESVTEVLVNGPNEIWLERQGRLSKHEDEFLSRETFRNFFERLFLETKTEVTVNVPYTDTTWLNHRVHLAAPPIARDYTLSLRKKSHQTWSLERLRTLGWADSKNLEILKELIKSKKSMLIVGGTSSGKTSVLNACLQEVGDHDRVVIVEDTQELTLPNLVSTNLLSRTDSKGLLQTITLHDLVKQSLRMRPDRIVMGEVRGAEAKDLLMALSTGHEGSMGTLHANSAQEALLRLEMLIQLGAPQWSIGAIRRLVYLALNYIVVVKRGTDGKRGLEGIYRVSSVEDFGFLTEKVSI